MPDAIVYPFITLGARLFGDLAPSAASAVEAVKNTPAPILLIHGEADHFVPCHMSETIRQARPDMIQRHTFPEAGHGISFVKDPDRYRQLVTDFISICFATIP